MAEEVIAGDKIAQQLELEFEQPAVSLLALQQPMARDLRSSIGAIKVSSDLERVGDHAVNIAESAMRLIDAWTLAYAEPGDRGHGAPRAGMLRDALDAFIRADGAGARGLHG